jgi:hypothetical protein
MSIIFKMAAKTRHIKLAGKIQHCPISSKFDMWVDNDVPNWFPTLKNFYWSPFMVTYHYVKFYVSIIINLEVININVWNFNFPIGFYSNPHPPLFDIIKIWYMGWYWFPTLKNVYRSPFSKWPPQYCKNSTLSDII